MSESPVLLMVTVGTRDEAENLGEGLVEKGLARHGSVVPMIHSFWMAAGRLERGHEALLLVTTTAGRAKEVEEYIRKESSFDSPHVLTLPLSDETSS